jgi:threonine dehydrogenase-like Zn-dependent dehydrogenase
MSSNSRKEQHMKTMKAVVFKAKNHIAVEEVPRPVPRAGEAVIRITTTTICGTDVHIVRGEYPVRPGLIIGHEPVGMIDELGPGLDGLAVARELGANVTIDIKDGDPTSAIKRLTDGRGVDVAIEALGRQETFENALRAIRPGGTLSSLGVYSGKLVAPYEAFYAGLGDQKIVTTLCPGGKERMRRLMAMIQSRRVDLTPLITHQYALDDIEEAFELFSHQRDGVLKVALYPNGVASHRHAETA